MCGSREHGNISLRPLRRGRLVVRASETEALDKSEPGAAVAKPTRAAKHQNGSKCALLNIRGESFCTPDTHVSWNRNQQATESACSKRRLEVLALAHGLAAVIHCDAQLRRNGLLQVVQGIVHFRKHAFARRFAEELRHSEQIAASLDFHPQVICEIQSMRFTRH